MSVDGLVWRWGRSEFNLVIMSGVMGWEGGAGEIFPEGLDIVLLLAALASTSVSLLLPCLFYLRKECVSHPQVLIANISLLEAVANFNIVLMGINIFTYEREVDVRRVFHLLTFELVRLPSTDEDTDFCVYNYWMYMLVELVSISFHICYSLDLFLTLKFPFLNTRKRRTFYYAFSALLPAAILALSWQEAVAICSNELVSESIYKVPFWFLVTLVVFCGISVAIVGMSFLGRRSEAKIRRDYIRQHRVILSLLVVLWVPPIWSNILIQTHQDSSLLFDILNKAAFFCIVSSTGVVCVVRMAFDPVLRQRIRVMLCDWSARSEAEAEEEGKGRSEAWNLPLSGAMSEFHSQEIVHNIIQVVCEACTAGTQQSSNLSHFESRLRGDASMSSVASHCTIIVEEDHESEATFSRLFLRRQQLRFQKMDPHECTMEELRELCSRKRRFQMVCLSHAHEREEERLGTKTVHLTHNVEEEQVRHMLSIKVTSYAHRVFEALRAYDGLSPQRIAETLDLTRNIGSIKTAKESLGASGSFFFFSFDHRIVIKTISEEEKDRFLGLLPHYFTHLRHHPDTLLARTYGIFSVEIAGVSKIYFLMMENAFAELRRAGLPFRVYDLKGSTVQRHVRDPRAAVLKDIDYFLSPDCFLFLSPPTKRRLMDQLELDVAMLRGQNIMDYSLLLAVGRGKGQRRELFARGLRASGEEGWRCVREMEEATRRVYSLSVIDYLQEFDWSKKVELWLKRLFKGGGDISSISSDAYSSRFMQFVDRIVLPTNLTLRREHDVNRTI